MCISQIWMRQSFLTTVFRALSVRYHRSAAHLHTRRGAAITAARGALGTDLNNETRLIHCFDRARVLKEGVLAPLDLGKAVRQARSEGGRALSCLSPGTHVRAKVVLRLAWEPAPLDVEDVVHGADEGLAESRPRNVAWKSRNQDTCGLRKGMLVKQNKRFSKVVLLCEFVTDG